ncbi:hypothetical protein SteCoe_6769 [Stentor coeruleus]|uniref:USP domain-containing protein n=1 Tax=Stentor coeruleus TaxID=5963 RepID=A0A1R2CP59_9CILI|nr:hypothetical protein SteCoe_6769 [Stentor coeruleus]
MSRSSANDSTSSSLSRSFKKKPPSILEIIGFHNRWGESNCFLNSALQILWHLPVFRSLVLEYSSCRASKSHYCLSCGLQEVFQIYHNSIIKRSLEPIDISKLRAELAKSYSETGEFEIEYPGDSIEALLALLNALHNSSIPDKTINTCCTPKCPSHEVFELVVEELLVCECSAEKKSLWDYSTFCHHFYVHEIFEDLENADPFSLLQVRENDTMKMIGASSVMKCESRLQEYIKQQWKKNSFSICPNECSRPESKKVLKLLQAPKVFFVNLIWNDFRPYLLKILQVFASIPYCVSMDNIYNTSDSTAHVLKSLIFYGSGHYISAIRTNEGKVWYKIDDEMAKKVGDEGSWKDLVYDALKNRFYPVGLFYEISPKRDNNDMTALDWTKMEKEVLMYLKKSQEVEGEIDWTCECGSKNNATWNICGTCNKLKPGVKGWVCKNCTLINENQYTFCKSCVENRNSDDNESKWKCACGTINKGSDFECKCRRKKVCKFCKKNITKKCDDCYTSIECAICKDFIPNKDGIICYMCKNKTSGFCDTCNQKIEKENRICEICSNKLFQCEYCRKFRFKKLDKCPNRLCNGKNLSPTRNLKFETSPSQQCKVCRMKPSNCICIQGSKCCGCNKVISRNEIAKCYSCAVISPNKCADCIEGKGVAGRRLLCKGCYDKLEKCSNCGCKHIKGKKCESSRCSVVISENSPSTLDTLEDLSLSLSKTSASTKAHTKSIHTNCKICDRSLSSNYGFCLDCKLKIITPLCKFCRSGKCTDLCENCIRSTILCENCNHQYHIATTCSCQHPINSSETLINSSASKHVKK